MTELPAGWQLKRLGDCLEKLKSGKSGERGWSPQCLTNPAPNEDSWGVLKTTAVQMGSYEPEHNKELPKSLEPKIGLEVNVGDFLVTTTGPRNRCGVVCLVNATPKKLIFSGKILRFRPDEEIVMAKWLMYLLMSPNYQKILDRMKVGTSDSSVSIGNSQVLDLEILVPPISEQRKIAETLEEHLSRLDAGLAALERTARMCRNLIKSSLQESVKKAINDSQTQLVSLETIAKVTSGATPLKSKSEFYKNGNIPWITSGDLAGGLIKVASQYVTEMALKETSIKLVPAGSLLVAMYGEGKTRGTVAELGIEGTTNQACASITFKSEFAEQKDWIRLVLENNYQHLRTLAAGGVQPNLNLSLIKGLQVPLPTEIVRNDLLNIHKRRSRDANYLLRVTTSQIMRQKLLRSSLLNAAFTGQLNNESQTSGSAEDLT